MTGSNKPFSQADHAISDPISRKTAAEFLPQIDPRFHLETPLEEQKEEYKKWDFTIFLDSTPITVETEQKRVWTASDGTFPYNTIDVPTRKWESKADLYIMFNLGFDALAMTEMKTVLNAEFITKSTRRASGEFITQGETFFHVPVEQFRFYTRPTGVWQRV
jgi:hypothetical protein